jgi:hypothetical protein
MFEKRVNWKEGDELKSGKDRCHLLQKLEMNEG